MLNSKAARWAAWTAGGALFYAILLGEKTLDALDKSYPFSRSEVCRLGSPETLPRTEDRLSEGTQATPEIAAALACVPRQFVQRGHAFGTKLIITDQPLSEVFGGHTEDEWTSLGGIYDPKTREMWVNQNGSRPGHSALHEFGHMLDHAMDYPSLGDRFADAFEEARTSGRLRQDYVDAPKEVFAESFARFYFSDRSRDRLEDDYPAVWSYFRDLEGSSSERAGD